MANFQITPFPGLIENTEFTFRNLYLHQIYSGANTNQSTIIFGDTYTQFGLTAVNNWAIYDGVGPDAKVVAHAKGMHMNTVNWYNSFNMVFDGERFKGSTLQVMGPTIEGLGDWAIVGGTGMFEFARGIIKRKVHEKAEGKGIYELSIRGFCAMQTVKGGSWGRKDAGSPRELTEMPRRLESVTIQYYGAIDAFSYTYTGEHGQKQTVGPWCSGWKGNKTQIKTFTMGPSEILKQVSGTFTENTSILLSVTFVSNIKTYGPFGGLEDGEFRKQTAFKFSVDEVNKSSIVGFYGTTDNYIRSFGVYTL